MDATLKAIVGLLGEVDIETRCAALLVLSHLKATDPAIVSAIGELLGAKNAVVRDFALAYFEQARPRQGISYLLPLLDSEDEAVRERAVAILARYGAGAVSAASKLFPQAPRRRLNAIIDLCARVRSGPALDLLFAAMAGNDFDANRGACDALIAALPAAAEHARADLLARAAALAALPSAPRSAPIAAAKLFGALGDAQARRYLLPMLESDQPHPVRTHAVHALQHCLRGQKLSAAELDRLLPLLDSDDEAGILRPAIQLLDGQPLDRGYLAHLNRLAESPQPLVKRFAVHKLAAFESAAVVKTLMGYLTDDSFARRDEAATSLKKMPGARTAVMKELLACEDEREAWALADILLAHDREWKAPALAALWDRMQHAFETREDRLYTAHFHCLNGLAPEFLAGQVRARAEQLRKKKDFAGAARWLGLLQDVPGFDSQCAFDLSVAELKAHPRGTPGGARKHDPTLDRLRQLADSRFPVVEGLRKERALTPEDLLYVAFSFAEGNGSQRALARGLLEHLAKQGRTKVGKTSRNKLRLLGSET